MGFTEGDEMIFEDVLEIKNGKNQKAVENPKGKYPIYGSGGIIGYANDYICDAQTVVIGRKGSINNPLFVEEPFWNVDTAFGLSAKREVLLPRYLYYFCKKFDFERLNKAVTIPSLTKSDLLKIEITLPDLKEQQEIVDKLLKIDQVVNLRKKELNLLDNLIKARFVELFGDVKINPNSYEIVNFEDCVEYMGDIGSNGANSVVVEHLDMKDEEDYALMVRFLNFTKNDFTDDVKYVSKEAYDFFKKSQVFGGELIICKIGSAGQNYVMPYLNRPVSLGLNQIMVRINKKVLMPYFYQYLHTEYGKMLIESCINGAVTKSITKTELKKIPVIIPPMELQEKFSAFVEQTDKSKFEVQKGLNEAQLLMDVLMQKYFGGK